MANWSDLKAAVASIVKTNGNKEITGQLLQNVLNNIISNVGLNSSFAGIATPGTNPGVPDGNVFYLATTAGTYSNFNGIVINSGEAVILEWKGSWVKKDSGFATQEKLSELEENTNKKLSELGSEVLRGGKVESFSNISNNSGAVILKNVKKDSIFLMTIKSATSDENLYLQGFDEADKLVRLMDLPKIGMTYTFVVNKNYKEIFLTNLCGIDNAFEIEVLYSSLSLIEKNVYYLQKIVTGIDFKEGKYLSNEGKVADTSDTKYHATPNYYKLGECIHIKQIGMGNNFPIIAFYDENKQYIGKISNPASNANPIEIDITKEDYPTGAVYCRFAYYGDTEPSVESDINEIAELHAEIDKTKKESDNLYKTLSAVKFKEGYYLNNEGNVSYSIDTNYHADFDYYKLKDYIFIRGVVMGNNFPIIAFYDENKQYIGKISNPASNANPIEIDITKEDYPTGAVYCRFAYYGNVVPSIGSDITIIDAIEENIEKLKDDTRTIDYSKDNRLFVNGGYINMSGNLVSNESFSYTDFLEIPILKDIELIQCQVGNQYMAAIAFYDEGKEFISALQGIGTTQVGDVIVKAEQIPLNTKYVRVSGVKSSEDNAISHINYYVLVKEVIGNSEVINKSFKFKAFSNNSQIEPGGILTLPSNKVKLNSLLSVLIKGSIECVNIGVGYSDTTSKRTYEARWIELTQTQVKLYGYYNADNVLHYTYDHNIELTDKTFVSITTDTNTKDSNATTKLIISNDRGDIFENDFGWGQGAAFVENKNTNNSIDVSMQFMPRDISKKIWVFGDSYFTYWPKYLYKLGINSWLRNSQPGSSPSAAYTELGNLLSLGCIPNYVVWCLGMNGDTSEQLIGGKYVINDYQKKYIDSVKTLCDKHNTELVLMAIPTVPSRQKTGFRDYVKSLGVRYIDIYNAVGADEYGIWHGKPTLRAWANNGNVVYTQIIGDGHSYIAVGDKVFTIDGDYSGNIVSAVGDSNSSITVNGITYLRNEQNDILGLLSSDGIHPTDLGAKVIAYTFISEFSEISSSE